MIREAQNSLLGGDASDPVKKQQEDNSIRANTVRAVEAMARFGVDFERETGIAVFYNARETQQQTQVSAKSLAQGYGLENIVNAGLAAAAKPLASPREVRQGVHRRAPSLAGFDPWNGGRGD